MSYKLFYTFLLVLTFNIAKSSVGDPTIQAVCKITLNNGNIIEGLITLGYGGYDGVWVNGFYIEYYTDNKYKNHQNKFLALTFKSFSKSDSSCIFSDNIYRNCSKLKFLKLKDAQYIYTNQQLIYNDTIPNDTLKIITHIERDYLVLDSINIYFQIPSDTYLETWSDTSKNIKQRKIAINDITKFELIDSPQRKWLELIVAAKNKFDVINNVEESTGDFIQTVWYHELLSNKEEYDRLQKAILHNIER